MGGNGGGFSGGGGVGGGVGGGDGGGGVGGGVGGGDGGGDGGWGKPCSVIMLPRGSPAHGSGTDISTVPPYRATSSI